MNLSLDIPKLQDSIAAARYDAVVVGAGPYGLSAATHLLGQKLKVATFGKPLCFWREHMPEGMLLRSFWWASNLSDPQGSYGLDQYFQLQGQVAVDPLPIETFIDYGLWFQKQAVPDVDETYVSSIERKDGRFLVTLTDGRMVQGATVVMAPGLHYYTYRPPEYDHLPVELVSHSADHHALDHFAGKRVVMIGRGQAALETSALLHELGVDVQVIARHPVFWIPPDNTDIPAFIRQLRAPKAGMGCGWVNFLLEKCPYSFLQLPQATKNHILYTRHGPAGSSWLEQRVVGKVTIHEQQQVVEVKETDGGVRLTLSNNKILEADHVILATGYRADIKRLSMLESSMADAIRTYMGSPILNSRFESSIPGLYFIGFSAARSFGPFYRFVIGAEAAAKRVASAIARQVVQVE